ncbi:MAG: hypothetical protein WKG07_49330 [Hymenobacter sp.]
MRGAALAQTAPTTDPDAWPCHAVPAAPVTPAAPAESAHLLRVRGWLLRLRFQPRLTPTGGPAFCTRTTARTSSR